MWTKPCQWHREKQVRVENQFITLRLGGSLCTEQGHKEHKGQQQFQNEEYKRANAKLESEEERPKSRGPQSRDLHATHLIRYPPASATYTSPVVLTARPTGWHNMATPSAPFA